MSRKIVISIAFDQKAASVLSYSNFRRIVHKCRRGLTDSGFGFADTGAVYPPAARASPISRHVDTSTHHRSSLRVRRMLGRSERARLATNGVHDHRQLV